jgi:hypothetical protein
MGARWLLIHDAERRRCTQSVGTRAWRGAARNLVPTVPDGPRGPRGNASADALRRAIVARVGPVYSAFLMERPPRLTPENVEKLESARQPRTQLYG